MKNMTKTEIIPGAAATETATYSGQPSIKNNNHGQNEQSNNNRSTIYHLWPKYDKQ
jgi:hypothetical protein